MEHEKRARIPIILDSPASLVLDERVFPDISEVTCTTTAWTKDPANPVLEREYAWEGGGPYAYNTVQYDESDKQFVMWYTVFDNHGRYNTGIATSADGFEWARRSEPIPEGSVGSSVLIVPEARRRDFGRFVSIGFHRPEGVLPGRVVPFRSEDGLHWSPVGPNVWWEGPSDVINLIWDTERDRFVSYHKIWRVSGCSIEGEPIKGYFATFDHAEESPGVLRVWGREVLPELRDVEYRLRYDKPSDEGDGGGGLVTDQVQMIRVIGRAESDDLIHWADHRLVLEPPKEAQNDVQYYGMPVFHANGLFLALPRYFEGRSGKMDSQLAVSRDGIAFRMPSDAKVLECGIPGSWEGGMVISTPYPFESGGRLWMYYGGTGRDHRYDGHEFEAAVGRASIVRDRYAGLSGGKVTTSLIEVPSRMVTINASGHIKMRFLDRSMKEVGRHTWHGDAADAVVPFPHGVDRVVRVELDLSRGALYAISGNR